MFNKSFWSILRKEQEGVLAVLMKHFQHISNQEDILNKTYKR